LLLSLISTVGRQRRAMGCSFYQGFYLTERAPATDISESRDVSVAHAYSTEGGRPPLPASSQRHRVLVEVVEPAEPPLVRRRSMTSRANGQACRERRARNHLHCTKRNEHHCRELSEVSPDEPVSKREIGEDEGYRPDREEYAPLSHGGDREAHAIDTNDHEGGRAQDQCPFDVAAQEQIDRPGKVEERLLVEERCGCSEAECIAARPDWEKIKLTKVSGVDLSLYGGVGGLMAAWPTSVATHDREYERYRQGGSPCKRGFEDPTTGPLATVDGARPDEPAVLDGAVTLTSHSAPGSQYLPRREDCSDPRGSG